MYLLNVTVIYAACILELSKAVENLIVLYYIQICYHLLNEKPTDICNTRLQLLQLHCWLFQDWENGDLWVYSGRIRPPTTTLTQRKDTKALFRASFLWNCSITSVDLIHSCSGRAYRNFIFLLLQEKPSSHCFVHF